MVLVMSANNTKLSTRIVRPAKPSVITAIAKTLQRTRNVLSVAKSNRCGLTTKPAKPSAMLVINGAKLAVATSAKRRKLSKRLESATVATNLNGAPKLPPDPREYPKKTHAGFFIIYIYLIICHFLIFYYF